MSLWQSIVRSVSVPSPSDESRLYDQIQAIDWYQFEKLISALFEAEGHRVHRKGGAHPDGGIDLIVNSQYGETLVQCKHWKAWNVGVRQVRELMGSMMDSGIHSAILVTLRGYTAEAKELAAKHQIVVLNGKDVLQMVREAQPALRTKLISFLSPAEKRCPKCESKMVLRTAKNGENAGNRFWGCSTFPRCRYILKVG